MMKSLGRAWENFTDGCSFEGDDMTVPQHLHFVVHVASRLLRPNSALQIKAATKLR